MSPSSIARASITLDELIAFNDELAALVRAGIPLDQGLANFSRDATGELAKLSDRLSRRLASGESLPQALAAERAALPPLYGAVVSAGVEGGRLPAALERLAETARRLAELRRTVGLAWLYPLGVLLLAWSLLTFMLQKIAPALAQAFVWFESPASGFQSWVARLSALSDDWWSLPPLFIMLVAAVWWLQSRRSLLLEPDWSTRLLGWIPWYGGLLRHWQAAAFADTLALLVEQRLTLVEAVPLAAQSTGSRRLERFAGQFVGALERGEPAAVALRGSDLPPLLRWLLGAASLQGNLAAALRQAADDYRQRAIHRAELIRTLLPLMLTIGIGGTAALVYALLLFVPWTITLQDLAQP